MNVKTPVLIYADLTPEMQLPDDRNPSTMRIGNPRCQARARGDTRMAEQANVPKDGGYRCKFVIQDWGLCWRHVRAAPDRVRRRALELQVTEELQPPPKPAVQ